MAGRHGSPAGSAYALATLAAVLERRGDLTGAQILRLRAWRVAASVEDAVLRHDLFAIAGQIRRDIGPIAIDDSFCDAIVDVATEGLRPLGNLDAQRAFIRDVLARAVQMMNVERGLDSRRREPGGPAEPAGGGVGPAS